MEEADTRTMMAAPREAYTKSLWAVRGFRATPKATPAADAQPLLSVQGVFASYGRFPVLHDVTLDLHKGRTVSVVLVDVNNLTAVNKEYGVRAGDEVLRHVAKAAEGTLQQLPAGRVVARLQSLDETIQSPCRRVVVHGDDLGR